MTKISDLLIETAQKPQKKLQNICGNLAEGRQTLKISEKMKDYYISDLAFIMKTEKQINASPRTDR